MKKILKIIFETPVFWLIIFFLVISFIFFSPVANADRLSTSEIESVCKCKLYADFEKHDLRFEGIPEDLVLYTLPASETECMDKCEMICEATEPGEMFEDQLGFEGDLACNGVEVIFTPPGGVPPTNTPTSTPISTIKLEAPITETSAPKIIGNIIKTILTIVGALALGMFVYGGFTWLTSGGSPDRIKKGRDILVWAVIGLVIIFASYTLVDFLLRAFGL